MFGFICNNKRLSHHHHCIRLLAVCESLLAVLVPSHRPNEVISFCRLSCVQQHNFLLYSCSGESFKFVLMFGTLLCSSPQAFRSFCITTSASASCLCCFWGFNCAICLFLMFTHSHSYPPSLIYSSAFYPELQGSVISSDSSNVKCILISDRKKRMGWWHAFHTVCTETGCLKILRI